MNVSAALRFGNSANVGLNDDGPPSLVLPDKEGCRPKEGRLLVPTPLLLSYSVCRRRREVLGSVPAGR